MAFDLESARPVDDNDADNSRFDVASATLVYPPSADEHQHFDLASARPVDDEYDMSEYDGTTVQRLTRKARAALRDLTGRDPRDHVSAEDVRRALIEREGIGTKVATAAREAVLNAASGIVATPIAGLAGLVGAVTSGPDGQGAQWADRVQHALTFEPVSPTGKAASEALSAPMSIASEYAGNGGSWLGGKVGALLGGERGALLGEAAGRSAGEVAPATVAALAGGAGALKQARQVTPRVPVAGEDYSPLRHFTPEEEARYWQQRKVGAQPTLGSVTRSPEQMRFEEQTAKTTQGAALRQREVENNAALMKAVEDIDHMQAGNSIAENQRATGEIVSTALAKKAAASREKVTTLYDRARAAGETKEVVDTRPLESWLREHRAEAISVPEIKSIGLKLKELKEGGGGRVTIDGLENLYQAAGDLGRYGESSGKYMRDVKRVINTMTEGKGGDLYRQARSAREAHAMEFEDRSAIANLVENKPGSRTDPKTAHEDVFNRVVVNSSLQELRDVMRSLMTADAKRNPEAVQAVRELQNQTIDHLVEQATKGIATDERGMAAFSPSAYRNAIQGIGRDKLDFLLGKDATRRVYDVLAAARDLKTMPGRVSGSDTAVNLKTEAMRVARQEAAKHLLSSVPGAGNAIRSLIEYQRVKADADALSQSMDEALTPRKASPEAIQAIAGPERDTNRSREAQDTSRMMTSGAPAEYAAVAHASGMNSPASSAQTRAKPLDLDSALEWVEAKLAGIVR